MKTIKELKENILEAFPPYPPKRFDDEPNMPEAEYKIYEAGYHQAIDELIIVLDKMELREIL